MHSTNYLFGKEAVAVGVCAALKKDDVISFREWVFKNLKNTGLLKENIDPKYGIVSDSIYNNTNNENFLQSGRAQNSLVKKQISLIVKSTKYESFCSQPL